MNCPGGHTCVCFCAASQWSSDSQLVQKNPSRGLHVVSLMPTQLEDISRPKSVKNTLKQMKKTLSSEDMDSVRRHQFLWAEVFCNLWFLYGRNIWAINWSPKKRKICKDKSIHSQVQLVKLSKFGTNYEGFTWITLCTVEALFESIGDIHKGSRVTLITNRVPRRRFAILFDK